MGTNVLGVGTNGYPNPKMYSQKHVLGAGHRIGMKKENESSVIVSNMSIRKIKPIETEYSGYRFRSRLEARWAVYFDTVGIEWEYEKEGYILPECGNYLPDFWLTKTKTFVEIKGESFTEEEEFKCFMLAGESHYPVLMISGLPEICKNIHGFMYRRDGDELTTVSLVEVDFLFLKVDLNERSIIPAGFYPKDAYNKYGTLIVDFVVEIARTMQSGVNAAKSARFEHGETPIVYKKREFSKNMVTKHSNIPKSDFTTCATPTRKDNSICREILKWNPNTHTVFKLRELLIENPNVDIQSGIINTFADRPKSDSQVEDIERLQCCLGYWNDILAIDYNGYCLFFNEVIDLMSEYESKHEEYYILHADEAYNRLLRDWDFTEAVNKDD